MAPPKKNEFLDASDSEDDQASGYDSDDEVAKGGRSTKRRKVDSDEDDVISDAGHDASDAEDDDEQGESSRATEIKDGDQTRASKTNSKKTKSAPDTELPDVTRPLTKKNLIATDKAIKKSGVVFLSRIPPFMKPAKIRSLLEPYGTINRTFLAPEDPVSHARRVRAGGNKKRLYTEGWVEFVRKKDAKAVCELLNARIIGGKKGSYYHDDIWNLVYLKGFKWHHLTEQIAAENAERASRMRAEISKATKENKEFVRNVEKAKMLDGMQAKSKKRKAADAEGGGGGDDDDTRTAAATLSGGKPERARTFKQVQQIKKADAEEQPERVTRVLSKIF
ncbi:RNA-binding ATPase activator esf2 [Purpureocillium takamizusanense]|uniref:18S rRNA factor 2 n=1 Tax=Purpureocillium takamizusanense TaxID=2060973 RepID=A0A9Q8QMV0_9HYPO|nr:RNA-binding ATPase activator esf2 [Purpureocillium takamizusanense]UNI21676.1 RNA-binding ATPase activator esf2 [Purpureocillium takamizusanense]